jgi:hypothetical protein
MPIYYHDDSKKTIDQVRATILSPEGFTTSNAILTTEVDKIPPAVDGMTDPGLGTTLDGRFKAGGTDGWERPGGPATS